MTNQPTRSALASLLLCLALAGCGSSTPTPEAPSNEVLAAGETTDTVVDEMADEPVLTGGDREPNLPPCPWNRGDDDLALRSPDGQEIDDDHQEIVDYDGDGIDDLVINLGDCDQNNDCMFVLVRGCVAPGYDHVFGPERASNLLVGEWSEEVVQAPLFLIGRAGSTDTCDVPTRTVIRSTQSGLERSEPCQMGGGIWDESCEGPEPPHCED